MSSLRGYFALPLRSVGDAVDDSARKRFDEAIFVASQQLDAVELLRSVPHRAESIHVLVRALETLESAIGHLRAGLPDSVNADDVVPNRLMQSLQVTRRQLEATPRLDVLLSRSDLRLWRTARSLARRLCAQLPAFARPRRVIVARRIALAASALGTVAFLLVGWTVYRGLQDRVTVAASDFSGSDCPPSAFHPEQAIDGDPATEWLAPDGRDGWLELKFAQPTHVTGVTIANAPNDDRGTKALEVQLFEGTQVVQRTEVTLDPATSRATQTVAIAGTAITRARLTAHSHYGKGAGLAEVQVLEAPR